MRDFSKKPLWLALTGTLLVSGLVSSVAAPVRAEALRAGDDPIHIGVVVDGDSRFIAEVERAVERELDVLTAGEMDVRFLPRHRLSAEWTLEGATAALETLLAEPEVDIVLTLGILSSQRVCCLGEPSKPVLAATVVDAELQGLPRDGASSGVRNLTYLDLPDTTRGALEAFYRVTPFRHLAFLTSRELSRDLPELIEAAKNEVRSLGLEAHFVDVGATAEGALRELDALERVDAVYVWPLYRLDAEQFTRLVDGLIARGLPSYSALGGPEIEAGLLASRRESNLLERLSRRVALDLQRLLLGESAGEIPVELRGTPQLTINLETARRLGLEPPWEVLLEAEVIGELTPPDAERLDLPSVMRLAIDANLDLRARERSVAAGAQDVRSARALRRPQLGASVTGVMIDDDRAAASFGQQAERTWRASLTLEQLIYDEGAAANVDIQEAVQRAREAGFESLRLDIALEAGVTYLELLRAETLRDVQRNNLDLTRENLSLAELRVEVGAANPAEVFRWQAQIAGDRQSLIQAAAGVERARLALNRVLHRPLEESVGTVPVSLESEFLLDHEQLRGFIATPKRFRLVRDFNVAEGLARSPDLAALHASKEAQERRLEAARRAFYLPSVGARFSLDHELDTSGSGAGGAGPFGPGADETDWSLALSASLDLLSGGARRAEEIQAREEIHRLELEIAAAEEATGEAIRAAMVETRASYLSIELAEEAAEAARRSQDLVADAYARGAVSVLDLLDAQNTALNAELAAANAVYDFFIDLLRVERATQVFFTLRGPAERGEWLRRLRRFFTEKGLGPWRPSPFAPDESEADENE